jgi:hypothetical protein
MAPDVDQDHREAEEAPALGEVRLARVPRPARERDEYGADAQEDERR